MRTTIKIFTLLATMLCSLGSLGAQTDAESLWERANTLYSNGEYEAAIIAYDSIAASGMQSARLYYNMGNAYFKSGQKGKSIVFYNRALRLDPADKDIAYNLAYANSFVKDKIEAVPVFFLSKWFGTVRRLLDSNAWAWLSLASLALTLAMVLVYLLSHNLKERKAGFCLSIVFAVLTVLTVSFASSGRREALDRSHAVVLSAAASVKSSPDRSSKDIFILHEGTMVKILNRLGEWSEIEIADGNEGWILNASIEAI